MNDIIMPQDPLSSTLAPMPYIHNMQGDKSALGLYMLYSATGQTERVSASTASEAISKASIPSLIRVLRHDLLGKTLLDGEDFNFEAPAVDAEDESAQSAAAEATAESATPVEDVAAASSESPSEPASESGDATPPA